jgi:hypothetical protein
MLKEHLVKMGVDTTNLANKDLMASVDSLLTKSKDGGADTTVTQGMWRVKHYVDEFGAETKNGYVGNAEPIKGTFSNSATQDSDLIVSLLIDKDLGISIKLYEYAHNNPVKAYDYDDYEVNVKDKNGKAYHLRGTNYKSDRLTLDKLGAKQLHAALLKGGKLQFVIRESDTPTNVYNFTIDNAAGYLDARKQLKG